MGKIFRSIAIGSIGLAAAAWCAAARAETLTVTWTEPSLGISVSWEQSSTAPPFGPLGSTTGVFVDVPISDFTSTGTTVVGPYTDIVWVNINFGGLFNTPEQPTATYIVNGPQAYSGDESAPTFLMGVYDGTNLGTGAAAIVTISSGASPVPETSTWAMMLLGFVGLAFAGYRASRRGAAARTALTSS
jgi:hypothetical protein